MLTSLFSLFYVTGEFHRFLHRGRAEWTAKIEALENTECTAHRKIIEVMFCKQVFLIQCELRHDTIMVLWTHRRPKLKMQGVM